jgi:hypothetical protein
VSFLRRLFGSGDASATAEATTNATQEDAPAGPESATSLEEAERLHELDLARTEAERLDELQQRQLRYARHAWTPPTQGGDQRADDAASPNEG